MLRLYPPTEKFGASTPMGRAMLNICIVFAQLERETIQKRVTDAWHARCQRGFKMGGKTPCDFRTEPIVMDGIRTKKLIVEPTEAAFVRRMYEMYEMYIDPQVSKFLLSPNRDPYFAKSMRESLTRTFQESMRNKTTVPWQYQPNVIHFFVEAKWRIPANP